MFLNDVYVKNLAAKLNCLAKQSTEKNALNYKKTLSRVEESYLKSCHGEGRYDLGDGKFCFDSGLVTDSGESLVCYCIPNRFMKGQSFCVGFGTAAMYGLHLATPEKVGIFGRIASVLKTRIF